MLTPLLLVDRVIHRTAFLIICGMIKTRILRIEPDREKQREWDRLTESVNRLCRFYGVE